MACLYASGNWSASDICDCDDCINAFLKWDEERTEREQKRREQLDVEGYYDDPEKWEREHGSSGVR